MDFLFHNISEKEREEIKKQVSSILQSFAKKLSEIDNKSEESFIEREKFERKEDGKPLELSREIMFENALEKNDDSIIVERRKW